MGSHQYTYFVFGFEEEQAGGEVEVSLNPHTAGADHDLFVCAGSCSTDADHSDAPSMEHYEYRSIRETGEDYVRISTDALVCGGANSTSAGGGPTPAPIGVHPFGLPCAAAQVSTAADRAYTILSDVSFGSRHAMVFSVKVRAHSFLLSFSCVSIKLSAHLCLSTSLLAFLHCVNLLRQGVARRARRLVHGGLLPEQRDGAAVRRAGAPLHDVRGRDRRVEQHDERDSAVRKFVHEEGVAHARAAQRGGGQALLDLI